jgi:hypothetical protein
MVTVALESDWEDGIAACRWVRAVLARHGVSVEFTIATEAGIVWATEDDC